MIVYNISIFFGFQIGIQACIIIFFFFKFAFFQFILSLNIFLKKSIFVIYDSA